MTTAAATLLAAASLLLASPAAAVAAPAPASNDVDPVDPFNPFNLTDCRGETAPEFDPSGRLRVLSWHIHYTTNTSDQERFYNAFVEEFQALFPPTDVGNLCPFGPNYGLDTYEYICSLEEAYEEAWAVERALEFEKANGVGEEESKLGGSPWTTPQRAFFVPLDSIDVTWAWAQANRGYLDLLKHPNSGCMHDDHSVRALWNATSETAPTINVLEFPCNVPATGCNDTIFSGPPSCGCDVPVEDDSPESSCANCLRYY